MKKLILSAFAIIPALAAQAQSPVDAMALSQTELRGSARFMSMGGAFTALGADLSVLGQNPAGIGMYRGSDIGLTLGIDINSDKAQYDGGSRSESNTLANINNAGYVGTYMLGDNNDYSISWGFSYNRLYRFNRSYMGNNIPMQSSVTNYFAGLTNGYSPNDLLDEAPNDPYNNWSQDAPDWMSVLLYNSGMINCETSIDDHGDLVLHDQYRGLWQWGGVDGLGNKVNPTSGFADFRITERGHADEYNISLGGSVMNLVYWGLGVGITDLDFTREYSYTEHSMERALIPAPTAGYELGDVKYANLYSRQHIWGTGANFKIGAIIKPINELRIGLAVHTPTYYSLSSSSYGDTRFFYSNGFSGEESTPYDDYSFQLNNPWKVMAGVAGVIGGRAIISVVSSENGANSSRFPTMPEASGGDEIACSRNPVSPGSLPAGGSVHTMENIAVRYISSAKYAAHAALPQRYRLCSASVSSADTGSDAALVHTAWIIVFNLLTVLI